MDQNNNTNTNEENEIEELEKRRYQGSDISKCGTSESDNIFDACTSISTGGEWSFRFMQDGSWDYHDHRIPGRIGTIVVQ